MIPRLFDPGVTAKDPCRLHRRGADFQQIASLLRRFPRILDQQLDEPEDHRQVVTRSEEHTSELQSH